MKTIKHIIIAAISLLTINSCDTIHEFPDENIIDPTLVRVGINITFNISDFEEIVSPVAAQNTRAITPDQTLRAIIEVYRNEASDTYIERREIIIDQTDPRQANVSEIFTLNASQYSFLVWIDYVNSDIRKDQFYTTTSNIRAIQSIEPYITSTDNRDCFAGISTVDLAPYRDQWNVLIDLPVELSRPVAKYALITNDVDKFITRARTRGETRVEDDINHFTAKIRYHSFAPIGFNVRDNQPNASKEALEYPATLTLLDNNEALICFDYPFLTGQESTTRISLQLYNDQGELINEIDEITIPITRGRLTVIRSDFLTRSYSPGITIDPGYAGDIPITIPD